jgi:hypothetical protein
MKMKIEPDSEPRILAHGTPLKGVGGGKIKGEVLRWKGAISFLGDVDPENGKLTKDDFAGDIKNRILVFEEGAGSTVGSYVVYNLRLYDKAPLAMVMSRADAIITIGCILADIPLINRVNEDIMNDIATGDLLELDPASGRISVWKGT